LFLDRQVSRDSENMDVFDVTADRLEFGLLPQDRGRHFGVGPHPWLGLRIYFPF
jgi:hypothetical protein